MNRDKDAEIKMELTLSISEHGAEPKTNNHIFFHSLSQVLFRIEEIPVHVHHTKIIMYYNKDVKI